MNVQILHQLKVKTVPVFFGLVFLLLQFPLKADNTTPRIHPLQQEITLIEAIQHISEKYQVLFNYDRAIISDIKVQYEPSASHDVDEAILAVLESTNLKYQMFNDRYVVIYRNDKEGIESLKEMIHHFQKIVDDKDHERLVRQQEKPAPRLITSLPKDLLQTKSILFSIDGTVVDQEGEPLIGVNIQVKGTNKGTATDFEGHFSLEDVDENAVLVVSYIGYQTQEVAVGGKSNLDITLLSDSQLLDEVVVTAFGLERDKKSLTFTTQNVDVESLSKAREFNAVNSLAGKVAGLNFQTSSTGVGGNSRIILRGNRSISGNSQPLYIVDGVPGNVTDLNPDDIENISVLKGPNAAALYGSQANNGAIVVTTKKGIDTEGKYDISINQSYTFDIPNVLIKYQNTYGQGIDGEYRAQSFYNWGPPMDGRIVDHWSNDPDWAGPQEYEFSPQPNNVKDFFQTGHNSATNLTISTGNDKNQTYFSYTYTDGSGVVPRNDLKRHNLNLRLTNNLSNKLILDSRFSYMRQQIQNGLSTSINNLNPMWHAYLMYRNIRTEDAEIYQFYDENGIPVRHFWNVGGRGPANPYGIVNGVNIKDSRDRINGLASLKYLINDNISLQLRSSISRVIEGNDTKYQGGLSLSLPSNGYYGIGSSESLSWSNDFLISYSKDNILNNWSFNLNAGGNSLVQRNNSMDINTGDVMTIPNFFAISNTQLPVVSHSVGGPQDVNSLYGFGQLSFKNSIFMDITGRNDWSSTLPKDNWSFFYPSIGLNAVVSDMIGLPKWVSFFKLRASLAIVGNGTSAYRLARNASLLRGGNAGFITIDNTLPNEFLKPERTRSIELGTDLRVFDDRFGIDFTYYKTNTTDQLFSISLPIASGASGFFTNGGDVQNQGIELILSTRPIISNEFLWDFNINFSHNSNKVIKIDDERQTLVLGSNDLRDLKIEQGKPWGLIYVRGFERDESGRVIVGENGIPLYTSGKTVFLGTSEPDWLGGIQNSFRYKEFSLNFLFDFRQGGVISSFGNSLLASVGLTKETEVGREGEAIFGKTFFDKEDAIKEDGTENDKTINVQDFWIGSGGRAAGLVGEIHSSSASNVRLREIILSYSFSNKIIGSPFEISFVGRNLFFVSNKGKYVDPGIIVGTGDGAQGDASLTPPTTRSIGLNLKMNF